jgi:SAM-dependent methyltransferase
MKYLKELCNVYWARPENIVGAARHMQVMDKIEFKGPSMDLMCGHGIYSFIMAGGDFDFDFDCYQEVVSLDQYKKGVDIQDHFSENYKPSITRKSKYQIDYGLDWKENNLKKCKTLDFYKNLVLANCNEKLPFEDSTFSTIFSNTVYWVEDIDNILKELNRIIKKDGKIYLINYLPPINDYISLYKKLDFPDEWITLVDRNRIVENKHTFSKDKWEKLFSKHGLKVTQYTPTLNQLFGHVWNIGLRPLAGYILDMSKKMKKEEYYDLKKKWVNTLYDFLKPYMEKDIFTKVSNNEEIEAVFVLEKK